MLALPLKILMKCAAALWLSRDLNVKKFSVTVFYFFVGPYKYINAIEQRGGKKSQKSSEDQSSGVIM